MAAGEPDWSHMAAGEPGWWPVAVSSGAKAGGLWPDWGHVAAGEPGWWPVAASEPGTLAAMVNLANVKKQRR